MPWTCLVFALDLFIFALDLFIFALDLFILALDLFILALSVFIFALDLFIFALDLFVLALGLFIYIRKVLKGEEKFGQFDITIEVGSRTCLGGTRPGTSRVVCPSFASSLS